MSNDEERDYWGKLGLPDDFEVINPLGELRKIANLLEERSSSSLVCLVTTHRGVKPTLYPPAPTGLEAMAAQLSLAAALTKSPTGLSSPLDDVLAVNKALKDAPHKAVVYLHSLVIDAPAMGYRVELFQVEHLITGPPIVLKSSVLEAYSVAKSSNEFKNTLLSWTKNQRTQVLVRTLILNSVDKALGEGDTAAYGKSLPMEFDKTGEPVDPPG